MQARELKLRSADRKAPFETGGAKRRNRACAHRPGRHRHNQTINPTMIKKTMIMTNTAAVAHSIANKSQMPCEQSVNLS
jgi:hypothetical protein